MCTLNEQSITIPVEVISPQISMQDTIHNSSSQDKNQKNSFHDWLTWNIRKTKQETETWDELMHEHFIKHLETYKRKVIAITDILYHHKFDKWSLYFAFSHKDLVPGAEFCFAPPTRVYSARIHSRFSLRPCESRTLLSTGSPKKPADLYRYLCCSHLLCHTLSVCIITQLNKHWHSAGGT